MPVFIRSAIFDKAAIFISTTGSHSPHLTLQQEELRYELFVEEDEQLTCSEYSSEESF